MDDIDQNKAGRQSSDWLAHLTLKFAFQAAQQRTILYHRQHVGPVRVQKMLWPEKTGIGHVYIVHPPAGIAGGDQLYFDLQIEADAHALVTTPGAGKWYRSHQKKAVQKIDIQVKDHAVFEWLPQESMLFNGANVITETQIQLAEHACFIGWDMLVLGRQARGERFEQGQYYSDFKLYQAQQLLVADRLYFQGNDRWLSSCLGMHQHQVMGSFWAVAPVQYRDQNLLNEQLERIRALMTRMKVAVQLTILGHVLCARFVGDDVRSCHDAFAAIRAQLRRYWFDLDEEFPRIWRT